MQVSSKIALLCCSIASMLLLSCDQAVKPSATGIPQVEGLPSPPEVDASSAESVKSYVSWLSKEENGFNKRRVLGQFSFEALIEPPAYAVLLNHRGERITNDAINNEVKEQSEIFQMQFSIGADTLSKELLKYAVGDEEEYQRRVSYYSFGMDKDIYLVVGSDTIPCATYQWERGFDASKKLVFQLVFSKKQWKQNVNSFQLVFYDRVFNNGIIKFFFGQE